MLVNPFNNNSPTNDPIRDNGNNISTWDGLGPYHPFSNIGSGETGGGGGGYVAPVAPNPTFVPPSYSTDGKIKVHLIANQTVQFTENDVAVGVGSTLTLDKTLLNFGDAKIYRAVVNGKRSKNYFSVSIEKTHNTAGDILANQGVLVPNTDAIRTSSSFINATLPTNRNVLPALTFGSTGTNNVSGNDYLFAESISVKEFELDTTTNQYKFLNERKVSKSVGTFDIRFEFLDKIIEPVLPENKDVSYKIIFNSNLQNELGNKLSLKYDILDKNTNIIKSAVIKLSEGSTDLEKLDYNSLVNSTVNFTLVGNLDTTYTYTGIYYTNAGTKHSQSNTFENWTKAGNTFSVSGKNLINGFIVSAQLAKRPPVIKPVLTISKPQYDKEVKDSDVDATLNVQFNSTNTDYVSVYIDSDSILKVPAKSGYFQLSFKKDFRGVYGKKRIILVPTSDTLGTGDRVETIINFITVNDFPSITEITVPNEIVIPSFSDLNITYDVIYNTFATTTVDVELLLKNKTHIKIYKNLQPNGVIKINLKELAAKHNGWNGSDNVTLTFKPYNRGGVKELVGNEYEVSTKIQYPSIHLDEDIIRKSIYEAFHEHLKFNEPEKDSKYLSHLANFDNDQHILISSWEEDNYTLSDKKIDETGTEVITNEVKSVILKLYEPLPAEIQPNTTFWITKLMTNPLIETVILTEQDTLSCPTIKGPNFNIEVDFVKSSSSGYESLDDLILSSSSSTSLIQTYLSASNLNTDDLNIEYITGSLVNNNAAIVWDNFVHFSSAAERVNNFVYKVQLIEKYESNILDILASPASESLSSKQDIERQKNKKSELIKGFDGFETLLYTSSSYTTNTSGSITWPYYPNTFVGASAAIIYNDGYIEFNDNYDIPDYSAGYTITFTGFQNYPTYSGKTFYIKQASGYVFRLYYDKNLEIPATLPLLNGNTPSENFNVYNGDGERITSTNKIVTNWYNDLFDLATYYDTQNSNYLINNIPQFITTNPENENFLLFFSMIGHHFDNIYYYTKAIERGRGMGYKSKDGIPDRLLFDTLQSFSWDAKNLGSTDKLWNYVFGEDSAGNITQTNPTKARTNEVWRRIVNNLPYLLKHKGSKRGVYALMACYGIPSSNLSIIEFGGPEVTDETKNKLLMDDLSHALKIKSGETITVPVTNAKAIELFVKPASAGNYTLATSNGVNLTISGSIGSEYGVVKYGNISSSLVPVFNGRFFGISVSNWGAYRQLDVMQTIVDREIFSVSATGSSALSTNSPVFGGTFTGSIDEIRVWNQPLSRSAFIQHAYYPEMVNGNNITSSTGDLEFRLDFEYPKQIGSGTKLINVAPAVYYSSSYNRNYYENGGSTVTIKSKPTKTAVTASVSGFTAITDYPYNFEVIDRDVVLELPDIGASRYATNKVRIEEQTLISDLSSKTRSTIKAFDDKPIDSNRVGLFFSPNKELNLDIAKSFGGTNLDNYIGDPSDRYNDTYRDLNELRDYYFSRIHNRDIYSYMNLIRLYEKAMFDDIKKMLPARSKPTTGLLIEPHFLERSKKKYTKPTAEDEQLETVIEHDRYVTAENQQYEAAIEHSPNLDGENEQYESNVLHTTTLIGENEQYDSVIDANKVLNASSEYEMYETVADSNLKEPTITAQTDQIYARLLNSDPYELDGFGLYASGGFAIRNYYNYDGVYIKDRVRVSLIVERKAFTYQKYAVTSSNTGMGDPRGGFITTSSYYEETSLLIQPYGANAVTGGANIVQVRPVTGYLPTHYRNVSDLTTGMQNSYYKGSKNTYQTTLDGTEPIETFSSNPNTIKIAGRDNNEPILEVE
jgi:hypothetical protein